MDLRRVIRGIKIEESKGNLNVEISSVTSDSRKVVKGALFVAIRGFRSDGHEYINEAIRKGASAIIIDREHKNILLSSIPIIKVQDTREALAKVSVNFFKNPSKELKLIGVTGTNGKTTTSYLIKSILDKAGKKTGLIGTIYYFTGGKFCPAGQTTPEAPEFQNLLRNMVNNGCEYAVSEVSSHALALKRIYGSQFTSAVFTNLTQDHLDFHADMEEYFYSKSLLFSYLSPTGKGLINIDDPRGKELFKLNKERSFSYGVEGDAHIRAYNIKTSVKGVEFMVKTPDGSMHITSSLPAMYNVYNILASIGVAYYLNISPDVITEGISSVTHVPGRFERIENDLGFYVIVDYAHTENALKLLLNAAAALTRGKIITVFGCGGDRDKGKRPKMGKTAMILSDHVIVTSDNPRSEDPMSIIKDIEKGIEEAIKEKSNRAREYRIIPDRRDAIEEAINIAKEGDLVIIAGKGHECYQIKENEKTYFDDSEEARRFLEKRKWKG